MMCCPRCRIGYTGHLDACALCGSALEGTPTDAVFPQSALVKPKKLAKRWLLGITIACIIATVAAGVLVGASVVLICAVALAVFLNYVFVRNIIVHAPDFIRMVERYFLVLLGVALLLFFATGARAIPSFAIPLVCIIALLSNGVLVILFRDSFVQGYAKYLLYDVVLGMVPLAFLIAGVVRTPALSIASAVVSVLLLVLMLGLTRTQLAAEMRKLFNA